MPRPSSSTPIIAVLAVLLVALAAGAGGCRSNERLMHTPTKAGPYGSEERLAGALALVGLVDVVHRHLEGAGVCYFATGRTLEGVWRHAAPLPYHHALADLAVPAAQFEAARQALLTGLDGNSDYVVEGNSEIDHLKLSVVVNGKAAAHVNIFVYSLTEDGTQLVHPWLSYKPAIADVFPTKLAAFGEGSIRVPADTREFLVGQYGSELDSPRKSFSWTHMSYVVPHEGMTTEFPLVTVTIPTYERPNFLAKAIELVHKQDYPHIEIVIVDDGSVSQMENPDMRAILSAPNVRYFHLAERCSIGTKRNIAAEKAQGEIIVHWDDDDYFREHRITAQVAPIIRGQVDMTVLEHHYYFVLADRSFYVVKRISSWGPHFGTFVFRKSLFDSGIRYPDNSMAEDYAFAEFALNKGATIYVMSNEDGKHVYVRHHNTWAFNLEEDFGVQVKKVDRPPFMSDRDWEYYRNLESVPMTTTPVNHYSSHLIQWNRPELQPDWPDDALGYPNYYPNYYPRYRIPDSNVPLVAKLGIGVGVGGSVILVVILGLSYYCYTQYKRSRYINYAPINDNGFA